MADHIISGILKDPAGEFSVGDKIRFTHTTTTGNTIMGAQSQFTVPPDGSYTIALQYGIIKVEYLDIKAGSWRNLGNITINQDTATTTLPGLLNALVPPTDSTLLEIQSLVADAEQYASDSSDDADRAETAAESIEHDNLLINGGFDIWQRGTPRTLTFPDVNTHYVQYNADRWRTDTTLDGGSGTVTSSQEAFTNGQTDVPDNPAYYLKVKGNNLNTGTDGQTRVMQLVENVATLAGKMCTLTFWAKTDNPLGRRMAVNTNSIWSATNTTYGTPHVVNLTASWQKFSLNFDNPSAAGKTIEDWNTLSIMFGLVTKGSSLGAGGNHWSEEIGDLGNDSISIAQVKLEEGTNYTGWPHVDPATELAKCQRYYQKITAPVWASPVTENNSLLRSATLVFPTTMRRKPQVDYTLGPGWSGTVTVNDQIDSVKFSGSAGSAVQGTSITGITLDAEL